jgi:Na+/alanine symporter
MAETIDQLHAEMEAADQKRIQAAKDAAKANYYKNTLTAGLGLAGNVAGIVLAVHRKSGFWGGVGWFIVCGLAGSAVGYVAGSMIDGKPKA